MAAPSRAIVMKVGLHLGEAWESILPRKQAEERNHGFIHWFTVGQAAPTRIGIRDGHMGSQPVIDRFV